MKTYITLFILFVQTLFAYQHEISIAAIFQDEARFLDEWIDYHHKIGVTHFRLYNNNSSDNYESVLSPWIDRGIVELIQWPHTPKENDWKNFSFTVQTGAYNNAINALKKKTKWLALIDTDEFITPTCNKSLPEILNTFPKKSAIYVHWCMFGTNGIWDCKGNLRGNITKNAPITHTDSRFAKSIVQVKHVDYCPNPHYCEPTKYLVQTNLKNVKPCQKLTPTWHLLKLNHYWTRDERFFQQVKLPRYENWGDRRDKAIKRHDSL